ncbi:ABC transporter permease [Clostridium magnum]|uniref:Outer membrane-specific lipoprotein transporter subunit LolC n=1 Tax=Clostridium magnum DSM 2767 TaxID=1121326 RepID=A0A161XB48_9CLOT|nr:FtsX-like permease family protein [Clostridium magnum]KZL91496.1 outer membrane-specific lipoprotein transporter subunit LolC [Clostridium magnum DSM 2767]SHH44757.1 putative ABC transport system permease protein [Clostridium magnum DSM 2767]
MIETANKRSIYKLSIRSLKANKLRNIFIIISIALTTILFTCVFTIGMSMLKSIEESTMRQVGGSAHGSFKYVTNEEFNKIKDHKLIKELGYSIMVGSADNKELITRSTEIRYGTDKEAELMFSKPTKGKMPEKANELATDTIVLDNLGIPHEIGKEITLSYKINGKQVTDTFMLSGYWEGDKVTPASLAWVSDKFIKTRLAGIDTKHVKKSIKEANSISGLMFVDVVFSNSFNVKGKLLQILKDSGYTEKDIETGVNWAYSIANFQLDFGTALGLLGAMLLILLSGYLIIYNIFYISVAKDTKFYGMLKTIGTTEKQIKIIVKNQARILSAIGIPAGLFIGYILGLILLPFAMQVLSITQKSLSFNPLIFIGSALFSIITISISCKKPAKIASKISPIEAVRYTGLSKTERKKIKNSTNGAKASKMALANIFRNFKKAFIVMLSLSLSIILLNSVYTIVTGFDMEKYISYNMISDFAIADAAYFNPAMGYNGQNTLSENTINEINSLQGLEHIERVYFRAQYHNLDTKALKWFDTSIKKEEKLRGGDDLYIKESKQTLSKGEIPLNIYGLDKLIGHKLEIVKGNFDAGKFASGNYVVIGRPFFLGPDMKESYYEVGDTIKIKYDNEKEKSYKVLAIGEIPYNISLKIYNTCGIDIYMTSNEFKAFADNPIIMTAIFDMEDKYIDGTEKYLTDYIKTKNPMLEYKSRKTFEKEFAKTQSTYRMIGYSLSFIIALIGILNFVNSMITNIISRRQEHAMLQSIGMTRKQLYKLLIFEGLYYALFTILIVCTLGVAINYFIVKTVAGGIWFFTYRFTLTPVLICIPFLIVFSIIAPALCYKFGNKMSIVERLREID